MRAGRKKEGNEEREYVRELKKKEIWGDNEGGKEYSYDREM